MKLILLLFLFPLLGFTQTQIGNDIDGKGAHDYSGSSISISADGSTVAIGAPGTVFIELEPGYVHIYKRTSGTWIQIGSDIIGDGVNDWFGSSVSLAADGNILAIGAPGTSVNGLESGQVRIYKIVEGAWVQIGSNINGESMYDGCGMSVSISADGLTVAIGTYEANYVRVYKNVEGTWTQIGQNISGRNISLAADGNTVAILSGDVVLNGIHSDYVRIYKNIAGNWIQIGTDICREVVQDGSVSSLSLSSDGTTVAIGAPRADLNGIDSGQVSVYRNNEGTWSQIGTDINGNPLEGYFGQSVSLSADGNFVAIGAAGDAMNGARPGHVRIYKYIMGTWTQLGVDIVGEGSGDQCGYSVSLSGSGAILAIGAPYNFGTDAYSGHGRVYDLSALLASDSFVLAHFSIYPNPVSEIVNISLQDNLILEKVNIYNALGQLVTSEKQNTINVHSLSKGTYFVEVITSEGKATKTIVVE